LFRLPVGQISPYFEGEESIQIVRVLARTEDTYKPFEDLQAEIKNKLEEQARRDAAAQVLADLREDAVVMTIFDHEAAPAE
jgi:parvulin-like peptidyl-prolyl isomerase